MAPTAQRRPPGRLEGFRLEGLRRLRTNIGEGRATRLRTLRRRGKDTGIDGAVSVVFGLLLAALPGVGVPFLVWLIGAYAVMFGVLLIALALRVRNTPLVHRLRRNRTVR